MGPSDVPDGDADSQASRFDIHFHHWHAELRMKHFNGEHSSHEKSGVESRYTCA